MIDLTKLTPAPWEHDEYRIWGVNGEDPIYVAEFRWWMHCNAEFITLARNAFDVMMRRGAFPVQVHLGWSVYGVNQEGKILPWLVGFKMFAELPWPDPFTALVEADKWYRENVESQG